ncbi:MAG: NACHT domain-containing protein [Acidobacteria bacterium]|nr:NACHT domain-containing protein [Acidobacteriota bacterium]
MPAIECLLGSLFYAIGKPVVDAAIAKLPDAATGIIGNRADALVCTAIRKGWKSIQSSSAVNHDLQRAARRAYLKATYDLAHQAGETKLPSLIQSEIKALDTWLPDAPLPNIDTLLSQEPTQRHQAFHQGVHDWLTTDLDRWQPTWRATIERYAHDGWEHNNQPQDWRTLMTLYFAEEIKTNDRVSRIFDAEMLSDIRAEIHTIPQTTVDLLLQHIHPPDTKSWNRLAPRQPGLVSRPKHLAWLGDHITASPVLLRGEAGAGKSTLARDFAWQSWERGDTPIVIEQFCGRGRSLESIGVELAAKLPHHESRQSPEHQIERAHHWLRDNKALLILDDIWDESLCALNPGPPTTVIFTSRHTALPDIPEDAILHVEGFEPEETENLLNQRLPGWLTTHGDALRSFARRLEHLPYALAIAADLLRRDTRPRAEAIAALRTEALVNGTLNLPKLLRTAIAPHTTEAKALLKAVAVCSPDGVWLPLAGEMSGLDNEAMWTAANQLADTSLLRTIDRETSRFTLHTALRDIVLKDLDPKTQHQLNQARVEALLRRLTAWDKDRTQWLEPLYCVPEVEATITFLAKAEDWKRYTIVFNLGAEHAYRTGLLVEAFSIVRQCRLNIEQIGDRAGTHAIYGFEALILQSWGRLDEAMNLHRREEAICHELSDIQGLLTSYTNQALILAVWGQVGEAMSMHKKVELICEQTGDRHGLINSFGNQATILKNTGQLEEALNLFLKQEGLSHELADSASLAGSYVGQAQLRRIWGQPEDAMSLLKKSEVIYLQLGDLDGLQLSYGNQATIMQDQDRLDDAMALHQKSESICESLGDLRGLSKTYGNQALILKRSGRFDEAMHLAKKEAAICLQLGDVAGLCHSYGSQAGILQAQGQHSGALALLKLEESLCHYLEDRVGLQICYGNQAVILKDTGQLGKAMELAKKQEALSLELGDRAGLAFSLANQGLILLDQNKSGQARTLLTQALQIFTELNMPRERALAETWVNQI